MEQLYCIIQNGPLKCKKKNDLNDPGWGLKMLLETFGLLNRSFRRFRTDLFLLIITITFKKSLKCYQQCLESDYRCNRVNRHQDQKRCNNPRKNV